MFIVTETENCLKNWL